MSNNKRILILHSSSDLYGASKILIYTIISLTRANYDIKVVLSEDGPLVSQIKELGIDVQIIKLGILRRKYFNLQGLVNRFKVVRAAYAQLNEIVKEHNTGIIYSNTAAVLVGSFVAKKAKIKHVWHIHEIIDKPAFFSKFIGFMLKKADLIIVVSEQVKKHWERVLGQNNKLKVIYNGLDYQPYNDIQSTLRSELSIPDNKLIIGMIGRVNNWKGQSYFINIAALLLKKFEKLHFVMAGDVFPGYEFLYDELVQLKQTLKVDPFITDLGFRNDIPNILGGLDIFILPSILPDPLPTVVLEAMGSGKPVVATEQGGALEMVKAGETGVFIPWDNADAAANIIAEMINQNQLNSKGTAGKLRVHECFSLKAFQTNLVNALNEIIDQA